jgi:hypothetical protein
MEVMKHTRYTQVYKTGEKKYGVVNRRGRKPIAFVRYIEPWKDCWVAWEYIFNRDKVYMIESYNRKDNYERKDR